MPKYTYTFDFDLDAWVTGIEIEADSVEEAREIFNNYSLEYLIERGYIKKYSIKDLDYHEEENEDPWEWWNDEEEVEE